MAYKVEWRRQRDPFWFPAILYFYIPVMFIYVFWRVTLVNWDVWYGPILYLAELYGFLTTALFLLIAQKMYVPIHRNAVGKPSVDVLIPTYNEPRRILEPVVRGAQKIRGVRQVLILDDGNRSNVKLLAQQLGVRYLPRLTNEHAKAGNLNNGLRCTDAEFLILLDADHIPRPDFIEQTVGYFGDRQVALVQSPQTFYNTNSFVFRRWHGEKAGWSEQVMFYNCIQPAKNRWNAAFFVGTSAMLRRQAILSVGGFATGTATEDIHTSLRLHAKGWKSVFLPKPLAYGLEAASFKEFYKQRQRWAAGSLGLLFRSADSPLRAQGLTIMQRLNYLSATLAHLQGVQKICFFIIPILTLTWGISPINGSLGTYGVLFIAFFLLSVGSTWAYSRGTYHPLYNEAYSLANAMAHLGGIKGVIKVQKKFAVSQKLPRRKENTWLTKLLWAMLWVAVLALLRDGWLYLHDHRHYAVLVYSFVFITINTGILLSFLLYLRRYEQQAPLLNARTVAPEPARNYRPIGRQLEQA